MQPGHARTAVARGHERARHGRFDAFRTDFQRRLGRGQKAARHTCAPLVSRHLGIAMREAHEDADC